MKKLVVLTGAGISAESGISTFRDSNGLWEQYRVEDVATPEGWRKNPQLVTQFYNERRKQLLTSQPNYGHIGLAELEEFFDVTIITQNVDNLHERAGSKKVIHLHGELTKVRSERNENLVYQLSPEQYEVHIGDKAEDGAQLRPHIVWFNEAVPMIEPAIEECQKADIFVIVGTSMVVYPAAGLIHYTRPGIPIFLIDPKEVNVQHNHVTVIQDVASNGMKKLVQILKENYL